jgi:CPA1 family monovalent cation:H+ antiporter
VGVFELVIGLLFLGGVLALVANKVGLPYPALVALVGTGLALIPGIPNVELDPQLALALFVAPTLLDTAFDQSPRDLRRNLVPVIGLAIGAVVLTTGAVALAARQVIPDIGWASAIALGAVVAPPDAQAAGAVLRKLGPPHRLLVVLEGESLFNDATALIIYRIAVGATVMSGFSGWHILLPLLLASVGSVLAGWLFARLELLIFQRIEDVPISVLFQFVGTFVVWIVADHLRLSPIITMVTFAMTLAQRIGGRTSARHRIASYAVWEVAVLVLNVLAFVFIGLQLRGVLSRVESGDAGTFALAAAIVCVVVIVIRFVWAMSYVTVDRWITRRFGSQWKPAQQATYRGALVASWSGMRGIVTLAAALALPEKFPHRDIILFCALCVVLVTLVLYGMTLPPLMKRVRLNEDNTVDREITCARVETARAALEAIEHHGEDSHAKRELAREYKVRMRTAQKKKAPEPVEDVGLRKRTVEAQRKALAELRSRQEIGDDAFHVLEEEIDLMELCGSARNTEEE